MAENRGSYPHPVLDQSDDVTGDFQVINAAFESWRSDLLISFEIRITNDHYLSLFREGEARLSARWRSSATLSHGDLDPRVIRTTTEGARFQAYLPHDEVNGDVKIDVRLIAAQDIDGFESPTHNPIYSGARFFIREGDILADGGTFTVNAHKSYDPLEPPMRSWLVFEAVEGSKYVRIDPSRDDVVIVGFPEATLNDFAGYRARPDLQVAMVVLPVLTEVLWYIKRSEEASESFENRAWYQGLKSMLENTKSLTSEPFEQAQRILEDPIGKAFAISLIGDEE